jgi:hypothetical protein
LPDCFTTLTILNKLNLNRQHLNIETLQSRRISCTIQLNLNSESTLRLYTPTNNFNKSDLVEAELKPSSRLELVEARVLGTLSSS